jgi:hypothetical protein
MAFMRHAPEDGEWNDDTDDFFSDLENLALKFDDDEYLGMWWFYLIISIACYLVVIVLAEFILKHSFWFAFFEYGIFGLLYIPIVGNLATIVYCDTAKELVADDDIDCWDDDHLAMIVATYFGISTAVVMTAGVFPGMKAARAGIEDRWIDEPYFQVLHKLLLAAIPLLFAKIQLPVVGLGMHIGLICYLFWFECFKDLFVASIKMSVLVGQLWVFACAYQVDDDEDTGSDMLWGWIGFLFLGYAILPIKSLIIKREPKYLPYQRPIEG